MKESTKEALSAISETMRAIHWLSGENVDKEDIELLLPAITDLMSRLGVYSEVLRIDFPEEAKAFFRKLEGVYVYKSIIPGSNQRVEEILEEFEVGKDYPLHPPKKAKAPKTFEVTHTMHKAFEFMRSNPEEPYIYLPNLGGIEKPVIEAILKLPPLTKDSIKQWAVVMADACMLYEKMDGPPVNPAPWFEKDAQLIFEKSGSIRKNKIKKAENRCEEKCQRVLTKSDSHPCIIETKVEDYKNQKTGEFHREAAYLYIQTNLKNWVK